MPQTNPPPKKFIVQIWKFIVHRALKNRFRGDPHPKLLIMLGNKHISHYNRAGKFRDLEDTVETLHSACPEFIVHLQYALWKSEKHKSESWAKLFDFPSSSILPASNLNLSASEVVSAPSYGWHSFSWFIDSRNLRTCPPGSLGDQTTFGQSYFLCQIIMLRPREDS